MITKITKIYNNNPRWQIVNSTYHPTRDALRSMTSDESWDMVWLSVGAVNVRILASIDALTVVEQSVEDDF